MKENPEIFDFIYPLLVPPEPVEESLIAVNEFIDDTMVEMARDESQLFSSPQSRLHYLLASQLIPEGLYDQLSNFKKAYLNENEPLKDVYALGLSSLIQLLQFRHQAAIPKDLQSALIPTVTIHNKKVQADSISSCRVHLIGLNEEEKKLEIFIPEYSTYLQILDVSNFLQQDFRMLLQCISLMKLPFDAYAHGLRFNKETWECEALVLIPDYLIDVTAVASCYGTHSNYPLKQLISLFTKRSPSIATMTGNAVNRFLDDLIVKPDLNFNEATEDLFYQNPIGFSLMDDGSTRRFLENARSHFNVVSAQVQSSFEGLVDNLKECMLEPSFYSVAYGLQGRLDVFVKNPSSKEHVIIELKSGKPFKPNADGISAEHFAQIYLYYLLIQSVYGPDYRFNAQVLYSSLQVNALRKASLLEQIKLRLIQLRNALIILNLRLAFSKDEHNLMELIKPEHFIKMESFTQRDALLLINTYSNLSPAEKDYFKAFCGFVAREQFISKIGRSQTQYTEGLASLWILDKKEKQQQFMILSRLSLVEILEEKNEFPILILESDISSSELANFRIGDTLVLYSGTTVLNDQIFKVSLVEINHLRYSVRLRSRQFPANVFDPQCKWNLEHDHLDRGFLHQFQALLQFAGAAPGQRQLIMGQRPPKDIEPREFRLNPSVPEHLRSIILSLLNAKEYFLLWGPPGSGKTNMVIRYFVEALMSNTTERVLFLAFTNRAVDEICEVLDSFDPSDEFDFIRIGSRYAVHEKFKKRLLENKAKEVSGRKKFTELLERTRIFTGTVASIQGKPELFDLVNFDTIVVDEAGQILESNLAGLLCKFKRFILIGDHMQLPAVCAQTSSETQIDSVELRSIGFEDLSMSLFERLLKQCQNNQWINAYQMLNYQGRMHYEIMQYPAAHFYKNQLNILPGGLIKRQTALYSDYFKTPADEIAGILTSQRCLFISCSHGSKFSRSKINKKEAKLIARIVEKIYKLYQISQRNWTGESLGIISPFRAQITQIQSELRLLDLQDLPITIDTVERYQGGARDIILLSTVITDPGQLNQISSLNENGTDRKLNVSLTRAREQIILIGDPSCLAHSPFYQALMDSYYTLHHDFGVTMA